jgi:hypothetical protein
LISVAEGVVPEGFWSRIDMLRSDVAREGMKRSEYSDGPRGDKSSGSSKGAIVFLLIAFLVGVPTGLENLTFSRLDRIDEAESGFAGGDKTSEYCDLFVLFGELPSNAPPSLSGVWTAEPKKWVDPLLVDDERALDGRLLPVGELTPVWRNLAEYWWSMRGNLRDGDGGGKCREGDGGMSENAILFVRSGAAAQSPLTSSIVVVFAVAWLFGTVAMIMSFF